MDGRLKQKQNEMVPAGFVLGRPTRSLIAVSEGISAPHTAPPVVRLLPRRVFTPRRFKRSARVSRLVRSSRMGVVEACGPGLERADMLACSLCCQQYSRSSRGSSTRSFPRSSNIPPPLFWLTPKAAIGRRHGRPPDVIPRHVVAGFLESDRATNDSGVLAMKGICSGGSVVLVQMGCKTVTRVTTCRLWSI